MKLSFFGNGVMAEAMIKPLVENGYEVEVFGRDIKKLQLLSKKLKNKIEVYEYKEKIDISNKTIILCIKPHSLQKISHFFCGEAKIVISVLANTSIDDLKNALTSLSYIKAMPNIAASFQKSITIVMGDDKAKNFSLKILNNIGKTLWVESEKEFDSGTIIAGCAPAFLAIVSEALIDGGVKEGLKREDASFLTKSMFESFSELLQNFSHPTLIKDAITSPGGITIKGCATLEEYKIRSAFIKTFQNS